VRVGLVLGAGGVVGASWLIGALEALESQTGLTARDAEVVVGTSAGSVIGTLACSGIPPAYMAAYASGASLDGLEPPEGLGDLMPDDVADRSAGDRFRLQPALPPIGPGSWRMIASTLRNPLRNPPGAVLAGWLPRGCFSTQPISELVDRFVRGDWPDHPNLWVVAADYASGKRTVFGRDGSPPALARDAVAASCAIPAFYHPVKIGRRRYVDGGICSVSNADLLSGLGLDAVVVLNPMSSMAKAATRHPADAVASFMRAGAGRRLGHEVRKLRAQGTDVFVFQPTADDLKVMGANLMARNRGAEVSEQAFLSVARELHARRSELPAFGATEPVAEPVRRAA
jgi:NTE family protein